LDPIVSMQCLVKLGSNLDCAIVTDVRRWWGERARGIDGEGRRWIVEETDEEWRIESYLHSRRVRSSFNTRWLNKQ
jgi:hypothetical protein